MRNKKFDRLNLAISAILVFIIITLVLTYRGEHRWIGHAVVSIVGLITLGGMIITGMRMAGRLGASETGLLRLHRKIGIFFTILMVGTSLYGLWVVVGEEVPEHFNSPHAWLGVAVTIFALAQLTPSVVLKRTNTIRRFHRVIGYLLAALVIAQIIIGVYMVLTE